jgi:hypothetical protein
MASNESTQISLYEVVGDADGNAVYAQRFRFDVAKGSHRDVIQALARGTARPEDFGGSLGPEETLDIGELRTEGLCVYAFWLNAIVESRHRLRFVDRPFIFLPNHSSTNEDFWLENILYPDSDDRWASFAVDIGAVRSSPLAGRIAAGAHAVAGTDHAGVMALPFCFNVIDPELEAAPWVVPHFKPKIHGGVHPQSVVSIGVPLD